MISRAKLNANYGMLKYGDIGCAVQFNRYFTVAVYGNRITEELRVKNPSGLNIVNTKINRGKSVILYGGVTTQAPGRIHFTGLAGVSFGEYNIHDNVELITDPNGNYQWIVSDPRWRNLVGVGFKGEMTFALGEVAGINAGVLANINDKFSYFRVYIGLSLGKLN
ncbi:MAG: hypothetical protein AB8B56_01415 [Crocinitomicaceae bacterium]